MPHPNAGWLGAFQGRGLKKYCYIIFVFLIRLVTFKITKILSPERASERKGMSTVEQFIWVIYTL